MSNKRDPTEPSYFVSSVLRPIKNFFAIGVAEGPGYLLKEHFMETYATEVFDNVTQRQVLFFLVDWFYSKLIGQFFLDTSATSRP
jgi:hypothetical protein